MRMKESRNIKRKQEKQEDLRIIEALSFDSDT